MWTADSLEKTLCWERLRAGREGDNRGWDGSMASPTRWAWVWVWGEWLYVCECLLKDAEGRNWKGTERKALQQNCWPIYTSPLTGCKNKASRRQWSPGAAKTAKPPPTGTLNPYRQKSLPAQESYRAELSRERRSHLATICSILCAFRVWNKLVSSSSIYLKRRRVFLRS